jgi:hypothetical protein
MVAHSGFLTVARKVEAGWWSHAANTSMRDTAAEEGREQGEGEESSV